MSLCGPCSGPTLGENSGSGGPLGLTMASECAGPCVGQGLGSGHTNKSRSGVLGPFVLLADPQPEFQLGARGHRRPCSTLAHVRRPQSLLRTEPPSRLGQEHFTPVAEDMGEPRRTWPLILSWKNDAGHVSLSFSCCEKRGCLVSHTVVSAHAAELESSFFGCRGDPT